MKRIHRISLALLSLIVLSCGTVRHSTVATDTTLADSLWTYGQKHPDGFTINISTWTEPTEGIAVAYEGESYTERSALEGVISHSRSHGGHVGGWRGPDGRQYYFESVRLFPEDSLTAAINFGKANHQDAIYKLSTGQEIRLIEDVEFVSPTNLIIMYDVEVGKEALLQAVKDYGAELLYDYSIIPGIAIKIPEGKHILEAIDYFNQVKGVTAVERDHIYHLIDPVKPKLEVMQVSFPPWQSARSSSHADSSPEGTPWLPQSV